MSTVDDSNKGSSSKYLIGYELSLFLTLLSYFMARRHVDSHHTVYSDRFLVIALSIFAVVQLFVQLIFFLHLSKDSKQRWNNIVLAFAAIVVLILVFGSLWIMANLNYHHPHVIAPGQIIHDEGVHP